MFRHLNLENEWPGFMFDTLTNDIGTLRLKKRPAIPQRLSPPLSGMASGAVGFIGPTLIGVDGDGNVYMPDHEHHQVLHWRACDGKMTPLACFGGEGSLPGQLRTPRGVLVGPRRAIYVADSGNHRIQIVDLSTLQVRGVWGQEDPYGKPTPSNESGRFNEPWDLAADSEEFVYVVDHGNRRVQKFNPDGEVITEFWPTLHVQSEVPTEPISIATILFDGEERLLIVDRAPARLLVYQTDGRFDSPNTHRLAAQVETVPGGLVFVGDGTSGNGAKTRRGLVFGPEGQFLGVVLSEHGLGLILDQQGRLIIKSDSAAADGLLSGQVYAESGHFLAGPFFASDRPTRWQRIKADVDGLSSTAHVQFFTYTDNENNTPILPPPGSITSVAPVGTQVWREAPMDASDFLILHEPATFLWVAGVLQGDTHSSPTIRQMCLEYEHDGWLRYLPAIYARNDSPNAFLEHSLAAFENLLAGVENEINGLPALFDPWAVPDGFPDSWLDWLSTWLSFDLDETWTSAIRRQALAGAFNLLGVRGTVEGLKKFIALYAGIDAQIEEPAQQASIWSLPRELSEASPGTEEILVERRSSVGSVLGFTTMLAAAEPQGAVLGTTATLDHSHLIRQAEYGVPLFEDLAHRFCVHVRSSDLASLGAIEALTRIIDQEKPAHTSYHLCIAEPMMRVGLQARLGIDAIVGGPPPDLVLNKGLQLGMDTTLAESRHLNSKTIGTNTRVGVGTRLV